MSELPEQSYSPGDRVRVCASLRGGRTGTVVAVRLWGRYPVIVRFDDGGLDGCYHATELRRL